MPELPDVEILRRYFDRHCRGRTVTGLEAPGKRVLRNISPGRLRQLVLGKKFLESGRHGKHLFAHAADGDGTWLDFHFGMGGGLEFQERSRTVPRYAISALRARNDLAIYTCTNAGIISLFVLLITCGTGGMQGYPGPPDFFKLRRDCTHEGNKGRGSEGRCPAPFYRGQYRPAAGRA